MQCAVDNQLTLPLFHNTMDVTHLTHMEEVAKALALFCRENELPRIKRDNCTVTNWGSVSVTRADYPRIVMEFARVNESVKPTTVVCSSYLTTGAKSTKLRQVYVRISEDGELDLEELQDAHNELKVAHDKHNRAHKS